MLGLENHFEDHTNIVGSDVGVADEEKVRRMVNPGKSDHGGPIWE